MSKAENDVVSDEPANASADEELQREDAPAGADDLDADASTADDDDGVVITIGEESPPPEDEQAAPEWVRELRKSNREKDAELKRLREQVAQASRPAPVVLGPKPSLEAADFDAERFERELEAWHERKRASDDDENKKRTAAETAKAAWDAQLERHSKQKSELKVKDFDEADAVVEATFSVTQRGLIVHGADNSAVLFYALAKNPKKAKELAAITDPVKFAFAVAKLETQLKVTPRRAPIPERTVRGSASTVSGDRELERLRAEADRTGDRTKVAKYMKDQKAKGRK